MLYDTFAFRVLSVLCWYGSVVLIEAGPSSVCVYVSVFVAFGFLLSGTGLRALVILGGVPPRVCFSVESHLLS